MIEGLTMNIKLVKLLSYVICILFVLLSTSSCASTGSVSDSEETVDINSFNRISYDASKEYDSALEKYNNGCDAAPIIRDDESIGNKKIAVIIQGTSDRQLVEQALSLLDKYSKACFIAVLIEQRKCLFHKLSI